MLRPWCSIKLCRYRTVADYHWSHQEFIARPLSQRWSHKLQPLLAINSSRLVLAAGSSIHTYGFHSSTKPLQSTHLRPQATHSTRTLHPDHDITALVAASDDDSRLFVGYADGTLEGLELPGSKKSADADPALRTIWRDADTHAGAVLESLSMSSSFLLSLSATGTAGLYCTDDPDPEPAVLELQARSWCSYLSMHSSTPFAAFGTTSVHALSLYTIKPYEFSSRPYAYLDYLYEASQSSAVYAITSPPQGAAWGSSDQLLVSGWYDGVVRVYDLRASSQSASQGSSPTSHLPILMFEDPWSYEPIYSLSTGGGSNSHIVAGSARHSVLAFWDIRSPYRGWSVHAPGNDHSPVYSVIVDGSRVYGANESRGFVLDFGEGVSEETYPSVPLDVAPSTRGNWGRGRTGDSVLKAKDGVGFYVTKYSHGKTR